MLILEDHYECRTHWNIPPSPTFIVLGVSFHELHVAALHLPFHMWVMWTSCQLVRLCRDFIARGKAFERPIEVFRGRLLCFAIYIHIYIYTPCYITYWCLVGNEGMIQSILINDSPSNPQQPIQQPCVKRTSKHTQHQTYHLPSASSS